MLLPYSPSDVADCKLTYYSSIWEISVHSFLTT